MNGRSFIAPPGFRFHPDDEVLVFEYLTKKVLNRPMDFSPPELRSCTMDPWYLLGEKNKEVYYFVREEELERTGRETLSGYWEESEEEKVIEPSDHYLEYNFLEGRRTTFTFYMGRKPRGAIAPWFMHEFRLMSSGSIIRSPIPPAELGKWRALKITIKEEIEEDLGGSDGEVLIN